MNLCLSYHLIWSVLHTWLHRYRRINLKTRTAIRTLLIEPNGGKFEWQENHMGHFNKTEQLKDVQILGFNHV